MSHPLQSHSREQQLQEKRDRRRYLSLGLLIGMIIGVPVVLYFLWVGADEVSSLALGITLLLIFVGLQLFLIIRYRDKISSFFFGRVKANNDVLVEAAFKAVGALSKEEQDREAFQDNALLLIKGLVARYSWMRFQRWLFSTAIVMVGGFAGLLGSVLLFKQIEKLNEQNDLFQSQNNLNLHQLLVASEQLSALKDQNDLFNEQNEKIDTQTVLLDNQNNMFNTQNGLLEDQIKRTDTQLVLASSQNELLNTQNDRIKVQNNLIEADRRSSLVFLMSNILDKLDQEIKDQREKIENPTDSTKYSLSGPLIARIVALSRSFQPYVVLSGDSLSSDSISQERGQLFISLMQSSLDSATQNYIVQDGDFSYAKIGELDLSKSKLSYAKLEKAILQEAFLRDVNFVKANLKGANLKFAILFGADLSGANLEGANLREAFLNEASLFSANLKGVDMKEAFLKGVDMSGASLHEAFLQEAEIMGANLGGAILFGTDLKWAYLNGADMRYANLNGANLEETDLEGADLEGADLMGVKNITFEQLLEVKSLYKCKNLDSELEEKLREEKPCLFIRGGCN